MHEKSFFIALISFWHLLAASTTRRQPHYPFPDWPKIQWAQCLLWVLRERPLWVGSGRTLSMFRQILAIDNKYRQAHELNGVRHKLAEAGIRHNAARRQSYGSGDTTRA